MRQFIREWLGIAEAERRMADMQASIDVSLQLISDLDRRTISFKQVAETVRRRLPVDDRPL